MAYGTEETIAPVRRSVVVRAPLERAFEVFTSGFASWWPSSHSVVEGGYGTAIIEPAEGGRWYERGSTGAECVWGHVLAWEPPSRVLLSWHLDEEWRVDPDAARASEVEVTFTPEGDGTRVTLEHRGFERRAGGAEIASEVAKGGGWGSLLETYAAHASS
ncbi:MAG TPA: SRPBCC family protein [Solirubrobacteraceae bacterium]|nr:SRPBCC family protein [Solirubrobacteraceae bacterium]